MKLPLMMCYAWRGGDGSKTSNGRLIVLASTEPHAVWLMLVISHLGLTQTVNLKVSRNINKSQGLGNASIASPF